nr:reverse transcriptase domain-containing protein [Tanacetum cinerariifolium]
MAAEENGDLPVPDLRTMKELCQPSLNGRGGPITPITIQATNFGLKNDMIQQVQNSCQFHGLPGGTFMKRSPEECYDLIENMTVHQNDWDTSAQRTTVGNTRNVYTAEAYQGSGTLPGNTITNPKEDLKVERETEATKDMVHPTNNGSTKDIQPHVVQTESLILNSEPVITPIIEPFASPFGPSIKTLLTNKDKLCELARTLLNKHCSMVLLKKFPEKLGDPGKFLILCDFPRMAECLAMADLGASINLMPLGHNFQSRSDFKILSQLQRHDGNRIDVIDMACEEYSQEVLGFSDVIASGNPTPYYDPIVSTTSSTLTSFGNSDSLLEEVDAFLALEDDPTSAKVDQYYVDTEGDILLLEAFLNDDPSLPPVDQGNYLPQVRKELKIYFSGKLKSYWSGPFTISYVFPYGTVELSQPGEPNFKVNGHRLKHYFGEDIPKMVIPDLQTFSKDK